MHLERESYWVASIDLILSRTLKDLRTSPFIITISKRELDLLFELFVVVEYNP